MTVLELWLQTEGCPASQAAALAQMLQQLSFEAMWRQRDAWGGMALSQLWKWRRLYDVHQQLHAHLEACSAPFQPFLMDAPSVRLAAAAPPAAAAEPERFLETARILFGLGVSRSLVRFVAAQAHVHEAFEELLALCETPEKLPAHRVLCALRAHKAGALNIEIHLPMEEIARQWELRKGSSATGEEFAFWERTLPRLVWEETVLRAQTQAVDAAAGVFRGLLSSGGIDASRGALGLYIGAPRQSAGAVYVDANGRFVEQTGFPADEKGFSLLCSWCAAHPGVPVVLPAAAPDASRLQRLRRELSGRSVTTVQPCALLWSRRKLPPNLPAHVASARVLIQRAMDPLLAFSEIPASRLGLAEYQPEIPDTLLQPAFSDMAAWMRLERENGPSALRIASAERFLPGTLIRTLADLRPGMQISGIVTSIVPFGVFVNLGLEVDGFIHVSELPEKSAQASAFALQLGQRVLCRVLQIDREKKRISLSLRPPPANSPARRGSKHAQLQKLDSLFRK